MKTQNVIGDGARILLGGIRVVNGSIGLLYPQLLLRQLGSDPVQNAAGQYAFRLFGVRTILIGLDLLRKEGKARNDAIRVAPLVHASDTVAALLAERAGVLPDRAARNIIAISATNTVLSLLMQLSDNSAGSNEQ